MHARALLALHDLTLQELHGSGEARPLVVDVLAEGHTPTRVLHAARQQAPHTELVARFHGGFGVALSQLLAGRLDVAFGRSEGLGQPFPTQLARRLIRLEPLALLLPVEHPLADLDTIPLAALTGTQVDTSAGNEQAPEWVDLGAPAGGVRSRAVPPSPARRRTGGDGTAPAGRGPADPDPVRTVAGIRCGHPAAHRSGAAVLLGKVHSCELRHPALDALHAAADQLARHEHWLEPSPFHWIPDPDATVFGFT